MRRTTSIWIFALMATLPSVAVPSAGASELTKISLIRSWGETGMPGLESPSVFTEDVHGTPRTMFVVPASDARALVRQVDLGPVTVGEEFAGQR